MRKQAPCHRVGAAVAIAKAMVHRILCVMLMMMSIVLTVAAQDRHDDRALHERAIRLEPFIISAAKRYGLDARILRAICFIESRYRTNVVSPKGARGPMQFMPGTAARYGLRDPHNPEQAIDAAARYFRDLLRRFDGRVDLALAAYNAGEGTVSSFMTGKPLILRDGTIVNARGVVTGGIPPYLETQRYVRSVLALLDNDWTGFVQRVNRRSRFNTRRDSTLDAFDRSERTQKISRGGASSFIEIP
jgi:soluble lytic murein transglycosylase-like protein